ncbi:Glycerol dehydrogenase [Acaryochloris thomasi RCC1774]|uniref:Glycerol dehydrogenase n=1 Tax=Acaryochloris thomasi RCC1774 TaxID=1764569 RepID=A0A2W1JZA0_9CYAN|nr:iron-containing alcohol dehydrogenase family protein [Acaryochloris thomasi]PZD73487.1 Glycerol dehydrogenase [Acaryochloris thomasi RCC1774]
MVQVTRPRTTAIAPSQILRGKGILESCVEVSSLGQRPLVIGGNHGLDQVRSSLQTALAHLSWEEASYAPDCSEASLEKLCSAVQAHQADLVIGAGGGKALDAAKWVGYHCRLPVVTIPTSAATCAAWTALSNLYSDNGTFEYDVSLSQCPNLLILDYQLIESAPQRTLVAGIGDALAKWYEASVSSGQSQDTLVIAAVQQARVLRDILLQKSAEALASPGSDIWCQVVDASVLMAGVIGGLGGAQCRTVAAHAVHNGLTHLPHHKGSLHGEKVAYGILVQLRLEEMLQGSQLAMTARHQLLAFYRQIGLPTTLADLGMAEVSLQVLMQSADVACAPQSDLHHLPFTVVPDQLMAAMVSTTAPIPGRVSCTQQMNGLNEDCP